MFRPSKKDLVFFDLLSKVMDDTCLAADILEELFSNYTDLEAKLSQLEELEHKCDHSVHELMSLLNRSFITPLDREDIFVISKVIDNIMDNIESTGNRLKLFNIVRIREEAGELTKLISQCTKELRFVVNELKNMKTSKILQLKIIEVNRLENQGDDVYRRIIRDLFLVEKDPLEIIKWKELYEHMEYTIDSCEDVANVIEGVVSKNA